jgi:MtrB/PioB family decaheme-associated outer membrane protein
MKTAKKRFVLSQKILVLSLLAAFGSAHAEDEDEAVMALKKPDSAVSVGLGGASGGSQNKAIYGQYNGLRGDGLKLLLDADINIRDNATGIWTLFQGRNLGLENRELSAAYLKQGDWKFSAGYNAITHQDPRTVNTGLLNAGTTSPMVGALATPGSGADLPLSTKREAISLGGGKWINPQLLFELDFKNEDKDGARLAGRGLACGAYSSAYNVCGAAAGTGALLASTTGAMLLLPEPINTSTRQIEAKLSYSGQSLKLNGGYYGSFFSNAYGSLNPGMSGNLWNPDGSVLNTAVAPGNSLLGFLQQPIALSPDNQAHKFYVGGNYAFTPTTRANFKYAYTHATQNADFGGMGLTGAPSGISNLEGVVNTTLAQIGVTARPIAKLSLLGNLHYENKEDKTPVALYGVTGPNTSGVTSFSNNPHSSKKVNSKLEASYQLPDNYRATFGLDYQEVHRDRPVSTALIDGLSGLREDTRERGYRAELRRSMSETLNATVSYVASKREGSSWLSVVPGAGFPAVADALIYNANGAFPTTLEDRQRHKVKVSADWTPFEELSLQLMLENGKDSYAAPTEQGLRDTGARSVGVDMAWTLSDKWKVTGYWNKGSQTLHVNNVGYLAALENANDNLSIGVVGKPSAKYEVGANLSYMNDRNRYLQSLSSGAALVGGGLPDVNYRATGLKLFGKYAMEKNADVRVDLMHQRVALDDWTWGYNGTPFVYSDNTSVSLQPNQDVTFIGVTYIYKMK